MTRLGGDKDVSMSLNQWAEYMAACGHAPSTIGLRLRTIQALSRYASTDPTVLTRMHAISFLARDVAPWTKLTYWKGMREWSIFLREFDINPTSDLTKGLPRPRTPDPVARPIDDETIARLLAAKLSPRAAAYVRLALFAGLRVHEIAKIRGEHFDYAAGWLMVDGKGGVVAPVPIHPELRKVAETMPEFGYWFPSPRLNGMPVRSVAVSQTVISALRMVGSTATAHQLRDTAGTRMQRQVKDIRITQTMLRHRSLRSTQKYTGVADDSMHAAVLSLDWGREAA